ncbi:MAG TPA: hypothetical protein VFK47_13865 [Ktedonobacteraceae bacterium]|nr:hypothetical protein [Ktedonobacteraceae bacterium]
MRRKHLLLLACSFGLALVATCINQVRNASATVPGNNTRISLTSSGGATNGESQHPLITEDGKMIAFYSESTSMVPGDNNAVGDVFVRNISAGTNTRVSVSTSGAQADNGVSLSAMSQTGRYIVMRSQASNLIDGTTTPTTNAHLYVRDTLANTTTLITQTASGTLANGSSEALDISYDGRFVLLTTTATNLGSTVPSPYYSLYLLDRSTGTFTLVNGPTGSGSASNLVVSQAKMSCDGSFVVFKDTQSLISSSGSRVTTLLFDRRNGDKLTDITPTANQPTFNPTISCNGRYIAFASTASNLDPLVTNNNYYHAYAYDRINGTTSLLDQTTSGTVANYGVMNNSSAIVFMTISDNGVAIFPSSASNLGSSNSYGQLYVRDPKSSTTDILTQYSGTVADSSSYRPSITNDGKLVTYESYATNLTATSDSNGMQDIYLSETGL